MDQFNVISEYLRFERKVGRLYESMIAKAAAANGISKPEADVLLFLFNNPNCNTARDISHHRGFSKAYISKAVEQLSTKNMLSVEINPKDRRVQYLHIAPQALELVETLRQTQVEFADILTQGMSKSQQTALKSAISTMFHNVTEADSPADL